MQPGSTMLDAEALLTARLKLERLVEQSKWDAAADLGGRLVESISAERVAASAAEVALDEIAQIARTLATLGMLFSSHAPQLSGLLGYVLRCPRASPATLRTAAAALKELVGHDFDRFVEVAFAGTTPRLPLLRASVELSTGSELCDLALAPHTHAALGAALHAQDQDPSVRASGLEIAGRLLMSSPGQLFGLAAVVSAPRRPHARKQHYVFSRPPPRALKRLGVPDSRA